MTRIYWDTMLFIYLLEEHPEFEPRVQRIARTMAERSDTLVTSIFTVGEVLAGVYKPGASETVAKTKQFLRPPAVELLPLTLDATERYAQIRSVYRVKPADAIHLACAAHFGVDLFLTNDDRLRKCIIPGIDFIAGLDVNLF